MKKNILLPFVLLFSFQIQAQILSADTFFNKGVLQNKNFEVTIPFEEKSGWIIFQIDINGKPKRFLFDTGAGISAIDKKVVSELSLQKIGNMNVKDANNSVAKQDFYEAQTLKLGEVIINNSPICIVDFPEIISCDGIEGILGNNVINKFNWILDYETKKVTITDKRIEKEENEKEFYYYLEQNRHHVNILLGGDKFYNCSIDFGFNSTMIVPNSLFNQSIIKKINTGDIKAQISPSYGLLGKTAADTTFFLNIGDIQISELIQDSIEVRLKKGNGTQILIGADFFSKYRIKLDNFNQRYILSPAKKQVKKEKKRPIGLTWENGKIIVERMFLCSSTILEGIKLNDEVNLINNKSSKDFNSYCEFDKWIDLQDDLKIEFQNNKKIFIINKETIRYMKDCK